MKFALNTDIREVHKQLERYCSAVSERAEEVVFKTETVFRQKLDLGLFDQPRDRVEALGQARDSKNMAWDVQHNAAAGRKGAD